MAHQQLTKFLISKAPDPFRLETLNVFLEKKDHKPLVEVLLSVTGPQRISVAKLWYRTEKALPNNQAVIPPVLGLLNVSGVEDNPPVFLEWFATQMLNGTRPHTCLWTNQHTLTDINGLTELVLSDDASVARAGAAALIARAAWPTPERIDALLTTAKKAKKQSDKQPVRLGRMLTKWGQMRSELVPKAMEQVAGTYEVYLRIEPPDLESLRTGSQDEDKRLVKKPTLLNLGQMTLRSEKANFHATKVRFSGAISVNPVVSLMLSSMKQIEALKPKDGKMPSLDWPNLSLLFLPDPGKSWTAFAELPSRYSIQMFLIRTDSP